jgi:hypothetical protein
LLSTHASMQMDYFKRHLLNTPYIFVLLMEMSMNMFYYIRLLPGSSRFFPLKDYKEDLGKPYSKMPLH